MSLLYQSKPIKTEVSIDKELNRNYTSVYKAWTLKTDSPIMALQSNGIPSYFNPYVWGTTIDPFAWVTNAKANPTRDEDIFNDDKTQQLREWTVTINHSTNSEKRSNQTPRQSPIFEPPKIRGSFLEYMEQAFRDRVNKPIVNKAYEPIMPPLQKENSHDSLAISYNTPFISLSMRSEYRNTVNSTPIWGLLRRQVKLKSWNYELVYNGGYAYIHNDLEFLISRVEHPVACGAGSTVVGWYDTIPNMGFSQLANDGKQVNITDKKGVAKKEASYLDCNGVALTASNSNETWLRFEIESEKDFTLIPGLPLVLNGPFI